MQSCIYTHLFRGKRQMFRIGPYPIWLHETVVHTSRSSLAGRFAPEL